MARALYSNSDIYLLDCPFAALDSQVCSKVYHGVIRQYLKDKTVILVTHNLEYVKNADTVVIMKEGEITDSGTLEQLLESKHPFLDNVTINEEANEQEPGGAEKEEQKSPIQEKKTGKGIIADEVKEEVF